MKAQTNPFTRTRATQLRREATDCERLLWQRARGDRLGATFRRRRPFENFVLDFVCLRYKLVIEVDGSQHRETGLIDRNRTERFRLAGFRVLRFWNTEIIEEMDGVLEVIHRALDDLAVGQTPVTHPHPNPPVEGEGTDRNPS